MQQSPLISVVLPVYNGADFLRETLDAILVQTQADFELLVINDGSTDQSEAIIQSYTDSRIRYFHHPNKGFAYTLNRGIGEARGKYIARIDADDICQPERFRKQAAWLEERPDTALVGCFITFINEKGEIQGDWPEDRANHTNAQIRKALPFVNCIAHPGVMVRAEVFRRFPYLDSQKYLEDYDMWLRLAGAGLVMEKVPEMLLLYRVHTASMTVSIIKKKNVFSRHFHCKRRYLAARLSAGKLNGFDLRVFFGMCKDLVTATGKNIKQKL
ncbi:glycosyltransferase family 2 protein [Chitinophaga barathri]|uniref:Glycosyltransferase n=1 Tax=Chitinophaga barathri TaxID=1647451 RepID=A0A3N4MDT1_9BACT|nr:glycosyltransferase [Chitinophaga barathri]RPD41911.1 glycosyltransferase [Chitinophaga barathri]